MTDDHPKKQADPKTGGHYYSGLSKEDWDRKKALAMEEGLIASREHAESGYSSEYAILGPKEIPEGRQALFAAARLEFGCNLATKRKMVELANEFLDMAHLLNEGPQSLPMVLAATIEERGLLEHSIGEFFLLYGRFEREYEASNSKLAKAKMMELIGDKPEMMKLYQDRHGQSWVPLPFAIRNILAHSDNPNELVVEELWQAIQLLHQWVDSPGERLRWRRREL